MCTVYNDYFTVINFVYNNFFIERIIYKLLEVCKLDASSSVCVCNVIKKAFIVLHTQIHARVYVHTCYMFIFNNFYVLCSKSTSDLTIEVEEQPIYVHKAVLKIRSLYFRTMFQPNYTENKQRYLKQKIHFRRYSLCFSDILLHFNIFFLTASSSIVIIHTSHIKHF